LRPRVKLQFLIGGSNCGLTQRKFTRDFKLEALRQLAAGKSLARLARELELQENVLRRWQREYQEQPSGAFPGKGQGRLRVGPEREAELERKIGQLTLENDFLKKSCSRWRSNGC
jgi:transposase